MDWNQIDSTLHILAKRVKLKFKFIDDKQWFSSFYYGDGSGYDECLICGSRVDFTIEDAFDENICFIRKHAIIHLKEKNLLPFI